MDMFLKKVGLCRQNLLCKLGLIVTKQGVGFGAIETFTLNEIFICTSGNYEENGYSLALDLLPISRYWHV